MPPYKIYCERKKRLMAKITLNNLTKHFGKVVAVDGVDITVDDGEFLCILGPSGCGKSTALRMMAGFETPTAGDIVIDSDSIVHLPANKRPTAMVFQKYTLWPHMSVFDNVAFGLRLRRMQKTQMQKKVEDSLGLVGLAGYEDRYPAQLSGGQQQRVALARAIVLEPKILLLDEPFSSLDALLRVRLREELKRIQRQLGITTIFVTHDQEEALSLADRIAVMNAGQIEQIAPPSSIYAQPQSLFVADFIGEMNLFDAHVADNKLKVGSSTLEVPDDMPAIADAKIAVRPEDLVLANDTTPDTQTWDILIEQMMDLGHYRKVLGVFENVGDVKIYLPKTTQIVEGETLKVTPQRYLVYADVLDAPLEYTSLIVNMDRAH